MITINEAQETVDWNDFHNEISNLNRQFGGTGIEIIEMSSPKRGYFGGSGVNWPGKGTQDPKSAREFANVLNKAIDACEKFNKKYSGVKIVFNEED